MPSPAADVFICAFVKDYRVTRLYNVIYGELTATSIGKNNVSLLFFCLKNRMSTSVAAKGFVA